MMRLGETIQKRESAEAIAALQSDPRQAKETA